MRVLGIETSCDETGVAIYDSEQGLIAHETFSQTTHVEYGGVVPELASRDHIRKVIPMIDALLLRAKLQASDLHGIAYTAGPGLIGALMVGAVIAKSLSFAWNIPALGVHHMEGHLLAPMLETPAPTFPFLALLVSGGHTQIIHVKRLGNYEILGESIDDAAGEAFDKTAKILGLPYPGGPHLAKLATKGNAKRFDLPKPMIDKGLNFSFSGLKTAVARLVHPTLSQQDKADIAASFETAVVETLCVKTLRAIRESALTTLVIAGGVGANLTLRQRMKELGQKNDFQVFYPRLEFCTDNGAMIAYAGCQRMLQNQQDDCFEVRARWSLSALPNGDAVLPL